ncbi:MAG: MFS transporter [Anaerolineales bacterium]|nr:MFS transporter [Anaerolineales bacterium]
MNRNLLFLSLSLMTWGAGEGMWLLFQPLYLEELGAGPLLIGVVYGLGGLSMTAAQLPAGYLSDRFGRRTLLIVAWGLGALATWIMALATSLPVFVVGSTLYGLTGFVATPLFGYATAARGNWSVGRAVTLISAMYNLGVIPGPVLGGLVGDQWGLRANFFISGLLFLVSIVLLLFIQPQEVETRTPGLRQGGLRETLNGRFINYLVIVLMVMFCLYLPQPLSQNFLQNQRGLALKQIGVLISARSLGVVLLNLGLGRLNPRLGFLLAQAAMALSAALLWQGSALPAFLLGYMLLGSYQTAHLMALAQGRALLRDERMNLGYGLIETCIALVMVLAPPLAGYLYSQNPTWIYSLSLVLILAALALSALSFPSKGRDAVEFPAPIE